MSLQLPTAARRLGVGSLFGVVLLVLAGCSAETQAQAERWAMPAESPATVEGRAIAQLWQWSWVAALVTGIVVWGLIFWAAWHYRRRDDDEIPVQTRYNLPLEIFYTVAPIMMVVVLFYHTVNAQNAVLEKVDDPDHVVEVVGQQWSWTFNYMDEPVADGQVVYHVGTARDIPRLVLAEGETVEFRLSTPDVIHSFWIPGFLMKMDVVPGRTNSFQVTPNQTGLFKGKCTELCGAYHSRMLFDVEVVTPDEYDAYLQEQVELGNVAEEPLLGGDNNRTVSGLGEHEGSEE